MAPRLHSLPKTGDVLEVPGVTPKGLEVPRVATKVLVMVSEGLGMAEVPAEVLSV